MSNTCHAKNCSTVVLPRFLMCSRHWAMVPPLIQARVYKHYRPGQERDKNPSTAYLAAAREAIDAVARKEGLLPPMERLSETLTGPRDLYHCQSCSTTEDLSRWQEHDEFDKPEAVCVVLCKGCDEKLIEKHPRLYRRLALNEPAPGAMAICADCRHRDGNRCCNPGLRGLIKVNNL